MKDIFQTWIKENKENHTALIDKSYKNKFQRSNKEAFKGEININLATYGDAVLNLAFCEILFKNVKLSEDKQKYIKDEVLVNKIAKHYQFLDYIKYDDEDENIPKDYDWKDEKHKFIATAIEACIGAIFKEKKDFEKVVEIAKTWKEIIDK